MYFTTFQLFSLALAFPYFARATLTQGADHAGYTFSASGANFDVEADFDCDLKGGKLNARSRTPTRKRDFHVLDAAAVRYRRCIDGSSDCNGQAQFVAWIVCFEVWRIVFPGAESRALL
ncbi:hypothetical protein DFH08DRAFT_795621 [Mycena albidolilacea]|uniref:Uncharacterized protein n=1 Tax=Mycena albidolilacea TaxID=1033008 RepID=A0AAD7ATY1_9AGAR|nr:hypothetical protein DFH08DRAFT_795621 [Mycena albidolilacea]